jgi:hypothetical protein
MKEAASRRTPVPRLPRPRAVPGTLGVAVRCGPAEVPLCL